MIPALARLRSLPYLFTRAPLTIPYFQSAILRAKIREALAKHGPYDRIFVYSSAMAQYVDDTNRIPVLMDLVDVDSDKWRQYAAFTTFPFSSIYRREAGCLREYERKICARAAGVFVSTEREALLLQRISATATVHVVPNGVDTAYFDRSLNSERPATPTVTFTGDMSYFPNEEAVTFFARKVLHQIQKSIPGVRFLVVGRNPTAKVLRLQSIEGVEVTGFVPDVRTYLAKSHVSVAPFSVAAGIQNKILEAMAYGLPVVATSRTATSLSPSVAEVVETADSPEDLAEKVILLLKDPELAQRKGREGRCRVEMDYNWRRSLDRMLQLIELSGYTSHSQSNPPVPSQTVVPVAHNASP
jgi:sugar transferase (PEP-CTERM/EpsH1 system associated)